jgi:hypothetical protein
MIAPAAEQTLIPSAACFHVGNGDQRLRTHLSSVSTWYEEEGEYYHLVAAWKATKEEEQSYAENA